MSQYGGEFRITLNHRIVLRVQGFDVDITDAVVKELSVDYPVVDVTQIGDQFRRTVTAGYKEMTFTIVLPNDQLLEKDQGQKSESEFETQHQQRDEEKERLGKRRLEVQPGRRERKLARRENGA